MDKSIQLPMIQPSNPALVEVLRKLGLEATKRGKTISIKTASETAKLTDSPNDIIPLIGKLIEGFDAVCEVFDTGKEGYIGICNIGNASFMVNREEEVDVWLSILDYLATCLNEISNE